ncbi:SDR family oxidoreductase [Bacillus sp. FJAT-27986]|uniref:SDR family oxidoreductase n=1 Tax=Bacillus sp. FJAT-27986 TaxID=1743146 RepID=UPI00080AE2A5|nr:SDR family oxidoreductase [Bacillus sp. FJAT-27986]OCA86774.1 epimerase [Bacillus sp. FJAT-27986]
MNVLITGAAGYLGSLLVQRLSMAEKNGKPIHIIATDIQEKPIFYSDTTIDYVQLDIRSEDVHKIMEKYCIDTVVHLASIVTPGKKSNRELEYSVDVFGTENILKACVNNGVKRFIVSSSGAAYGYHLDNPEWITEDTPIRGNKEFAYSYHKRLVEQLLADYRQTHPELEQIIFRIGTILGETVNNQITALFEKKALIGIFRSDSPFVFIWDHDVACCLERAVTGDVTGIFNVAGDGKLTIDELAYILYKPVIRIPALVVKWALYILKRLSLTQYGEEQVNFLRYRPVLDNTKLKNIFGYTPTYTTREVFEYYLKHNAKMKSQSHQYRIDEKSFN